MKDTPTFFLTLLGVLAFASAGAQAEFKPPAGKGRAIVAVSGAMGTGTYEPAAKKLAGLGYDVFLYDGNKLVGDHGVGVGSPSAGRCWATRRSTPMRWRSSWSCIR